MNGNEGKPVDEQVRLAVDALPSAPVRWNRVARKARRRRFLVVAFVMLLSLALAIVVSTGLLAGKSALDPTYSPPLLSRDGLSLEFSEPDFGYGLTPLARYESRSSVSHGPARLHGQSLGYVFTVSLQGIESGDALNPRWRLRPRGNPEPVSVAMVPSEASAARGRSENNHSFAVWVERPGRSGQFVVDFSLVSMGGVIARGSSAPIHVVRGGSFSLYEAPSYVARVPGGWKVMSDYEDEPGRRFVTRLQGPHGMSVLIDTTLRVNGDPADSARSLEALFREGEENYKRLSFSRRSLGGPVLEWSFMAGERVLTDIFLYRGGHGYAVLAESEPRHFREARLVARQVARSLASSRSSRCSGCPPRSPRR